jgi:hypothetical protein
MKRRQLMPRELHPEGLFKAEIMNHGFGKSSTGSEYFGVEFGTLLEGDATGKITGFFYLTDAAAEETVKKIRIMGYEGFNLHELGVEPPILSGKMVQIQVVHESYQGKIRDKVNWVYPENYEPGLRKDVETASNVKRFDALLQKYKPIKEDDKGLPF